MPVRDPQILDRRFETQFGGPRGNPISRTGRPRGFSVRAAWRRKLAKGWEKDTEAENDDEKLGTLARQLADDLATAIDAGDVQRVRAIVDAIAEAEGKPKETVEHQGGSSITLSLETTSLPRSELCACCLAKLVEHETLQAVQALPPG